MTVLSPALPTAWPSSGRVWRSVAWLLLTGLSLRIGWGAFRYVTGDPGLFDSQFIDKYIAHLGVVWTHGVTATLALALGPWQFWPALRQRYRSLHRWVGILYMFCMIFGGTSAVLMGLDANGGIASKIGFTLMGVLWIVTTVQAWKAIRRRDVVTHRMWMTRNFALTFGAVMLRLYLYGLQQLGFEFQTIYPYVTWGAWLPNIVLAEVWIRSNLVRVSNFPA